MFARRRSLVLGIALLALLAGTLYVWLGAPLPPALQGLQETELTIRWTTENEIDVSGYNLYRSDTPDGDFVQVNDEPIPPSSDPFITTEHTFVDDMGIVRGQTYYYLLETVDRTGNTRQEGPFPITAD